MYIAEFEKIKMEDLEQQMIMVKLFYKFLKKFVNKSLSFPSLYSIQGIGELKKLGHQVEFTN